MRRLIVILIICWLSPPSLWGQEQPPEVVATGHGNVSLPPQRAALQIVVSTRAAGASEAAALNAARVDSVRRSLTGWSVVSDSIRIAQVTVSPNENYQERRIVDYEASATVEVVVVVLDSVGAVFDRALRNGATQIGGVTYQADSTDRAREQALSMAFEGAKADAEAIAAAAGLRLGSLVDASTSDGGRVVTTNPLSRRVDRAGSVPLLYVRPTPSEVIISASVTARWQLED